MKKSIFWLVCFTAFLFSCLEDDVISKQNKDTLETKNVITRKMSFEQSPHYEKVKAIITQLNKSINESSLQNKGEEDIETFDILTDEVIYMEYENSHTYTFKVRRSNPEYYIENVVLHYNPETEEYEEFLMQYLLNEQEYLDIVNDNFTSEDLLVIARRFENGTFSGALDRVTCSTSCKAVSIRCGSGDHGPGDSGCTLPPDQQAYVYISCTTRCNIDVSYDDGGYNGGGGGGTNTIPFPMEPCNTGGGGSGSSDPGTGIDNGNGMCVVPWVAAMNAQLNLTQAELRVLRDYPDLVGLFGYYFNEMGDNADYSLIRSLINYMIIRNNSYGVGFVNELIYLLIDTGYVTPIYTTSSYPGINDGMPFNWWNDYNYLSNNFTLDTYDPFKELTEEEKRLVKIFPTLAFHMNKNRTKAINQTQENFPSAYQLNDKADAFRHAYFNALNTKSAISAVIGNGAEVVRMFGEAHESEVPNRWIKEKNMDLFNNNVGINFCSNCSTSTTDNQISIGIMNLLSNGSLIYLFPINYNGYNQTNPPSAFWDNPNTQTLWDGHHGITTSTNMSPTNE